MGATTISKSFPASDVATLRKNYGHYIADQKAEYGNNPYSGSFATKSADSLDITTRVFPTEQEAEEWLFDTYEDKWGGVGAVRYMLKTTHVSPATPHPSEAKLVQLRAELAAIPPAMIARARAARSKTRGCQACGSSIATEWIGRGENTRFFQHKIACPVCQNANFLTTKSDIALRTRIEAAIAKLEAEQRTRAAAATQAAVSAVKSSDYPWLVGGWAPC